MDNQTTKGAFPHYFKEGEKAIKQHDKGRVCENPGCQTVLSVYNSYKLCSVHIPELVKPAR